MARVISPEIIYEDSDIIVCRKPAGLPTQSARIRTPDMVSLIKIHLTADAGKSFSSRKEPYLAVIHRLDQPVEGLLVFAKTPAAAKNLNRQLTSSGFGKYYRAIVIGIPEPVEGTLENYIVKDGRTNTSRICTEDTPGAKLARLHYHVKKKFEETEPAKALVEIRLDTGRHHQIRVQMSHLGHPLAGDRKYGSLFCEKTSAERENSEPLRLCAYRLEFRHPRDGRRMVFELPE